MIEEQYSLKKNGNKMLQKLSELKSYAKGQMDIKEQQAKFKEEREASVQEDKKNETANSTARTFLKSIFQMRRVLIRHLMRNVRNTAQMQNGQ